MLPTRLRCRDNDCKRDHRPDPLPSPFIPFVREHHLDAALGVCLLELATRDHIPQR
jgi:hypothetical protein